MKFRMKGIDFELSREEVIQILRDESFEQYDYFVEVEGKLIPVKEALYEILKSKRIGLTKQDFNTQDAVRIFKQLGFRVYKIEEV